MSTTTLPPEPGLPAAAPLVLLLSAAHPPDDIRVVRKEGAALAAAGWRVRHLAPGAAAGGPAEVAGVAIETYAQPRGWRGRLLGIPALARRAAQSGAAVIHASEPDAWAAAHLAARLTGARAVLDVHEHYPSRLDSRLPAALRPAARAALRAMCRLAGRLADAVVVAKDGLAGDFAAPARTIGVRNYAAPAAVAPRRHAAGPLTLVHAGAMGRARGWPQLLAAMALGPAGDRLRLIGRFTDGSEPAFETRAAALGLLGRIERLPGGDRGGAGPAARPRPPRHARRRRAAGGRDALRLGGRGGAAGAAVPAAGTAAGPPAGVAARLPARRRRPAPPGPRWRSGAGKPIAGAWHAARRTGSCSTSPSTA